MRRARYGRHVLESVALFNSLTDRERSVLEARCRSLRVPNGAYLYHEGQPGDALYVLRRGRIGIWGGGERGEPVLLNVMGAGQMFGELALLSGQHLRTASVQALSRVEAIQILRTDIDALRATHPGINNVFIQVLLGHVQRLSTQVAEMAELDAPTRIYRQIIRLGTIFDAGRNGGELPINQHQLASLTGVGLRITNKVLAEARADGLLLTERGRLVISDWATVRRRAGWRFRAV
jgi:CRP/FNR family transcriptional regulator, cyclic AMP receptor protein